MKQIKIEIGDYSGDGHGESEVVYLMCNKTIQEIAKLYKQSCILTGLQFTTNGDESGQDRPWQEMDKWKVLQDYGQKLVSEFQIEQFNKFGIDIPDPDFRYKTNSFTNLFLEFCKLSDTTLAWEIVEGVKEETLQLYIGYGIYE